MVLFLSSQIQKKKFSLILQNQQFQIQLCLEVTRKIKNTIENYFTKSSLANPTDEGFEAQTWKIGLFAGCAAAFFKTLFDTLVQNIQKYQKKNREYEAKSCCQISLEEVYPNFFESLIQVYKKGGFFNGLYKGFFSNFLTEAIFLSTFFALTEKVNSDIEKSNIRSFFSKQEFEGVKFLCGFIDGFIAKSITSPVEKFFEKETHKISEKQTFYKKFINLITASFSTGSNYAFKKITFENVQKLLEN
ncbi:carrier protein ymc2 -related [Anaeramoeba ignava]|uniref:Carrier protein ymc2 -related n=1 Tax=Anaeramoeba ignava TaxID=1746090 RepID=A0A9Q0RB58_ANAIG|nr:carrier protein ymc2 -related [Anaeramoeba ignava]